MHSTIFKKDQTCPGCGRSDIDAATHAAPGEDRVEPEPEDISICWYCGAINQFTEDMGLKPCDLDSLKMPGKQKKKIRRMSEMIKQRRRSAS